MEFFLNISYYSLHLFDYILLLLLFILHIKTKTMVLYVNRKRRREEIHCRLCV